MNYQKLSILFEQALRGERDHLFDEIRSQVHCMSRARVYALINAVVSSLEEGEIYLEVGTYQGGSLISALQGNTSRAIAVDSFEEFAPNNSYEQTFSNLQRFGVAERVALYNEPYQRFFSSQTIPPIQIYYYDGAHDYIRQLAGLETAWPFLKEGALVLVDDLLYPEVEQAIAQFQSRHSLTTVFVMRPWQELDPIWWNGFIMLQVHK